jgi:16S rRNA (cytosine967-C5)-methyltransferase
VLDLCAAPGAKTTHLAALAHDEAAITAVERHAGRAAALERTCARLHVRGVSVVTGDASRPDRGERFDRVLVDPPCTGLGTLRSRPDLRWRVGPGDMTRLARLQADVLDAAVAALAPGGTLVYSTCTISPTENEHQIAGLLARHPQLARDRLPAAGHPRWQHPSAAGYLQSLPHRDGTDGFFIARLRRRG